MLIVVVPCLVTPTNIVVHPKVDVPCESDLRNIPSMREDPLRGVY